MSAITYYISGSYYKKYCLKNGYSLFLALSIMVISSCEKLVEVPSPINLTDASLVYNDDSKSVSVITGIYSNISSNSVDGGNGLTSLSLYTGLSSDELTLFEPGSQFDSKKVLLYTNALNSSNSIDLWTTVYPIIFTANAAIEGISNSKTLTPQIRTSLLGEAKFIRAFCYFYLVSIYGDVPLATSTDYKRNSLLPRSLVNEVYESIISDLKDAQNLLTEEYLDGTLLKTTTERIRPNKWAAKALLARAYLYLKDYKNAELTATEVIDKASLYNLVDIDETFVKNNNEVIWSLQPVQFGINTSDALTYILPDTGPDVNSYPVYISASFYNGFELGDLRRDKWINQLVVDGTTYHYPFKYKNNVLDSPVSEYQIVLRLAEQYLIRAESRAQQNNLSGSLSDLNSLRHRARAQPTAEVPNPLPHLETNMTREETLSAVLNERKSELFTEWGHRWFDLGRTGKINQVMDVVAPLKGGTWINEYRLYPIPLNQMELNPNLVQNPGYK